MTLTYRPLRPLIASAMLLTSVAVAAAQTAPPPPTPGWSRHGAERQERQDWQAERAKMEAHRLAELHTKLDLKPTQEPAWQAFVTGLQAAHPAPKPHGKPDWAKMKMETTPERLDHMLSRIDDMRAHLAQLDQVVKTFYAGLSKDQQTIFDDNFKFGGLPHGGRGGPGAWEHHGMDHGHPGHGPMGGPPGEPGGPPPQN